MTAIMMLFALLLCHAILVQTQHVSASGENTDHQGLEAVAAIHNGSVIVGSVETKLEAMEKRLRIMEAKLEASESRLNALQLTRQGDLKIAFSAGLGGHGDLGPFRTDIILAFQNVLENYGNAYSPAAGIFTAPVRGVYYFSFTVFGSGSSINVGAVLCRNDQNIVGVLKHQGSQESADFSSNMATLLLEDGDQVYLRLMKGFQVYDNNYNYCSFNGHLLFSSPRTGGQ